MSTEARPGPEGTCRCGALIQQSWWQEVLENASYRVVRVDPVSPVADILTIEVTSDPEEHCRLFLTVADVDWSALLADLSEPVITRSDEKTALIIHEMLLAKVHELLAVDQRRRFQRSSDTIIIG